MGDQNRFDEINVEKLNIVNENNDIKMTLFIQEKIPPLLMNGEDVLPGHRQNEPISGIMFYNGKGDECGGLIYGSEEDEDGNLYAGASLTFDEYEQDQVVQMQFTEHKGQSQYGFSIYDRPDQPLTEIIEEDKKIRESNLTEEEKNQKLNELFQGNATRAFMGKDSNGDVSVRLHDSKGQPRIRMVVDANDVPRMEFLNEVGEVTYSLPPQE
ncbi:hypothetical protein [Alkalibacillus almallahensis]|uniref:hypothetical protein n=1 Tax=Alkalibacillus almallahensis TaxID=1379154 RepID=UPI001420682A|nr:hypothetical protein [Alkalibacillus almallahensis]NIK11722.1 hypothetical protein [Alkalibacillus almallahensis]